MNDKNWLGRQIDAARKEIISWPWLMICNSGQNPDLQCPRCGGSGVVPKYRNKAEWRADFKKVGKE